MQYGPFLKEIDAAVAYDILAIRHHGREAKTNFDYRKRDVLQILDEHSIEHVLT